MEILGNIKQALLTYDKDECARLTKEALNQGVEPLDIIDVLTNTIRTVGEGFGRGDLFLPDLVGAADAMQAAMSLLENALKENESKRTSLGKILIGTVAGDIHTIGKSMVATMLTAEGFEVVDLGIDIPAERFVKEVKNQAPDILAMSALLSTTAPETKKVIGLLEAEGLREKVKVIVGGGAVTGEFAQSIGADGYEATAPSAAKLARSLLSHR
jgi:corrinoid protein of di/trimethylamine methyltransferase